MDYQSTLQWLFNQLPMFSRTGGAAYKPGLERVEALDEFFGHPHRNYKTVHVAGTNGKGSVSHNLASILQEQGYKTGLYTSPHLVDFRERIRVNGEMISKEGVTDFVERFLNSGYSGHPSFFELTMMMAFDWFAKSKVDIAIIEVGMGGRLDSTNIIKPILSVITNISKDHTQFLGNTIQEIATEKAGIIKKDVPVVIGESNNDTRDVFDRIATEKGAPIIFAQDSELIEGVFSPKGFRDKSGTIFSTPLGGDYQRYNLNTVLSAVKELSAILPIERESVRKGISNVIKNTHLHGRWMTICESPLAIADTGHNVAGLISNFRQLKTLITKGNHNKLRLLLGFVADKDIDAILSLIPKEAELYITNADIPRALPAQALATKCREIDLSVDETKVFSTVREGWKKMLADSSRNDLLYVGGSTFVVADLLSTINS